MRRRATADAGSSLYAWLFAKQLAYAEEMDTRFPGISSRWRPAAGEPLIVHAWELPERVRRALSIGINASVVVCPDDSVTLEGATGWTPRVVD